MSKAIGLVEYKTIPKGIEAADAMLKASEVQLLFSSPICPGKYVTIVGGDPWTPVLDSEMERLQTLAVELGLHDLVAFAGARDQDLLPYYFAAAEMVVVPSHYESFGMVALESMAMGTPVIASRMSGNVGMLGYDYPGYFPVGDAEALWSLLSRCVSDSNLLSRLNTACAARAKLFSPETERASLCQMIDKLIAGSS